MTDIERADAERAAAFARLIARGGHLDNTGAPCRIDYGGHDCCYVCNVAQDMIASLAAHGMDAESIAWHTGKS